MRVAHIRSGHVIDLVCNGGAVLLDAKGTGSQVTIGNQVLIGRNSILKR